MLQTSVATLVDVADRGAAVSQLLSRAVGARIWSVGVNGPWVSLDLGFPILRTERRLFPSRSLSAGRQGSLSIFIDGPWDAYQGDSLRRQKVDAADLRQSFLTSYVVLWPHVTLKLAGASSHTYEFRFQDEFLIDFLGGREVLVAETRDGQIVLERTVST